MWGVKQRLYLEIRDRGICLFCDISLRRDNTIGVCRAHRSRSPVIRENARRHYNANHTELRRRANAYIATPAARAKKRAYDHARLPSIRANRRPYYANYMRERRSSEPLFNLMGRLRYRIWSALATRYGKNKRTLELLGADVSTVKLYLEAKFSPGMGWSNFGTWHIDHIVPLASASSKEEMERLCHYTNLQPLWAADNLHKSDRLISYPFGSTIPTL